MGAFFCRSQASFPLTGPVYENPDWFLGWLLATILVFIAATAYKNKLQKLTAIQLVVLIGLLQLFSTLLVTAVDNLWHTSYSTLQHLQTVFFVILNVLMSGLILRQAYKTLSCSDGIDKLGFRLYLLYCLIVILAVYKTYGLAIYGRYLSFPSELAYIPVTGLIGLLLIRCATKQQFSLHAFDINRLLGNPVIYRMLDKVIGYSLVFIAIALIFGETRAFMMGRDFIITYPDYAQRLKMALIYTLSNNQLLVWLFCLFVLAVPFLVSGRKNAKQVRAA